MLTKVQPVTRPVSLVESNDLPEISRFSAAELIGSDGMAIIEYRGDRYLLTSRKRPGELALFKI